MNLSAIPYSLFDDDDGLQNIHKGPPKLRGKLLDAFLQLDARSNYRIYSIALSSVTPTTDFSVALTSHGVLMTACCGFCGLEGV